MASAILEHVYVGPVWGQVGPVISYWISSQYDLQQVLTKQPWESNVTLSGIIIVTNRLTCA